MKWIIVIICLFLTSFKDYKEPIGCFQVDIILLGDISPSTMGYEQYLNDAFNAFVNKFELSESSVKIGIVVFYEYARVVVPLTSNKSSLQEVLKTPFNIQNGTNIYEGLEVSEMEFHLHGRDYHRKMIIFVSDGDTQDKDESIIKSQKLKTEGYEIFSILIKDHDSKPLIMKAIASEDYYVETNYEALSKELSKLDICF